MGKRNIRDSAQFSAKLQNTHSVFYDRPGSQRIEIFELSDVKTAETLELHRGYIGKTNQIHFDIQNISK